MNKLMLFAGIMACAMFFVSCGKDKTETKKVIDAYHDEWSGDFVYEYDGDGRVTSIARVETWDGVTYNTTYAFTYNGSTVTISNFSNYFANILP